MNWIYLPETLLRPTGHFFDSQKRQKKGRGILVWGKFYPFLFVSIFSYSISWESLNIFSWNFVQLFFLLVFNTLEQSPRSAGGQLWVWGPILAYVLIFLDICSIFSHETLYRCSWYNPDGHYTQNKFYIMAFLCWGSFGGILGPIFAYVYIFSRYPFNTSPWNFAQVFLV